MPGSQTSGSLRLRAWISSHRRPLFIVVFWLVIILVARQIMQANDLSFGDLINQLQAVLSATWFGPLLFIAVYMIRPAILFPASLLTILGGNTFGLGAGFVYVLIGGTLSALIPYLIGRSFTSDDAPPDAEGAGLVRFVGILKRNPFQAVLVMRLLYLPYDAVSVLAGTLRIPLPAFFAATALGNLGGTLSFVGIGASLEGDIGTGDIAVNTEALVFSLAILVFSLGLSYVVNQVSMRRQLGRAGDEVSRD